MSQKRFSLLSLPVVLAALAISAVGATAASATCYKVAVAGTGNWENSTCTTRGTTKAFIKVSKLETQLKPGEWCAKVEEVGTGTFSDNKCTNTVGAKEYIKVLLPPGGPVWMVPGRVLAAGETKNIAKVEAIGVQKLASTAVTVECSSIGVKAGATNEIIGGNPGTDVAFLVFDSCHVAGAATCLVNGGGGPAGEIWVKVKTLLGYKKGATEKEPIYEQFFPDPGPEAFVTLEFSGTNCGTLAGKKIVVHATGTEYTPFKSKCGVIAEVGKINAGTWEAAKLGELTKLGGLKLPTPAIAEEEVWNGTAFEVIKCSLTAGSAAATQSGTSSIELEGGEEFGVEI